MDHHVFHSGDISLHYTAGAKNGPPLVLLHGLSSRLQSWDYLLPDLLPDWQVFAVDLRGHGVSAHPPSGYRAADYAADISAFLQVVIDQPAVLLGHSLGAVTAILAAAQAGPAVRGLILCDPPLTIWHTTVANTPTFQFWFQSVLTALRESRTVDDLRQFYRAAMPKLAEPELTELAETLWQVAPGALEAALQDEVGAGTDIWSELAKIDCPALFLQGEQSLGAALWDEAVEGIQQWMPQAVVVKLPGFGHSTHMAVGNILAQLQAFRDGE